MTSVIDKLLRDCIVRVGTPKGTGNGTGFFVAPGLILTCAHVVKEAHPGVTQIDIRWRSHSHKAIVEKLLPTPYIEPVYPDIALLKVDFVEHPCVYFQEEVRLLDQMFTYGYPGSETGRRGDAITFVYEGSTDDQEPLLKLKAGQVQPGISGAPLLNLRTNGVCGVVKRTRDDRTDLGGWAVPMEVVLQSFPELRDLQQAFHQQDARWLDFLNEDLDSVLGAAIANLELGEYNIARQEALQILKKNQKHASAHIVCALALLRGLYPGRLLPNDIHQIEQHLKRATMDRTLGTTAWILLGLIKYDYYVSSTSETMGEPSLTEIRQSLGELASIDKTWLRFLKCSDDAMGYFRVDSLLF